MYRNFTSSNILLQHLKHFCFLVSGNQGSISEDANVNYSSRKESQVSTSFEFCGMRTFITLDLNVFVRFTFGRLNAIIDATGASSYHGFLPVLVRSCIQSLTDPQLNQFPLPFATALFSCLYHLASYEAGKFFFVQFRAFRINEIASKMLCFT